MASYPKISIITPSYNQGKYLEQTILSVIGQNYPNLEYIIIDGNSSDNSQEIIKKYEDKINYWVSEPDNGQSMAINRGIKKATGDIITWINSDDIVYENTFHKVAEIFQNLPDDTGLIHGGTILFDNNGRIKEDYGYDDPNIERYLSGMAFSQPSAFIRKKYLDSAGFLNDQYHFGLDYDLFARLSMICEFKKVPHIFSIYRIHSNSKSFNKGAQFIEEWIQIFCNIVSGLQIRWIIDEMKELNLFCAPFKDENFYSSFIGKIKLDEKLLFYYFLSYVLKSDYIYENFKRATIIKKYLIHHFIYYIYNEPEIKKITDNLTYFSPGLIKLIRLIKSVFK